MKKSISQKDQIDNQNDDDKQDAKCISDMFHLIPPASINISIIEQYVKIHFSKYKLTRKDGYDPYKLIGSQVAQQTLKKLDKAYKSFFNKKKSDDKARPPHYLNKNFNLIFQKTSFSVELIKKKKYLIVNPSYNISFVFIYIIK